VAFLSITPASMVYTRYRQPYLAQSAPALPAAPQVFDAGGIGYPDLASAATPDPNTPVAATRDPFCNFSPAKYAKFYTPAAITAVRNAGGLDFVPQSLHLAGRIGLAADGTERRQRGGGPHVLRQYGGALPPPDPLSCATRCMISEGNPVGGGFSLSLLLVLSSTHLPV
jgi:hypothetical protein